MYGMIATWRMSLGGVTLAIEGEINNETIRWDIKALI